MLIILTLYLVLMWLAFSKFKLVKWGWLSGTLGSATVFADNAGVIGLLMSILVWISSTSRQLQQTFEWPKNGCLSLRLKEGSCYDRCSVATAEV